MTTPDLVVALRALLAEFRSPENGYWLTDACADRLEAVLTEHAPHDPAGPLGEAGARQDDTKLEELMAMLKKGTRWPCQPHAHLTEKEAVQCEKLAGEAGARLRALVAAFDRTVEYIRTAMRPISIKEACGETAYDRAERRGLQHGLNALIAEFGKAGVEYPAASGLDALLSAPVVPPKLIGHPAFDDMSYFDIETSPRVGARFQWRNGWSFQRTTRGAVMVTLPTGEQVVIPPHEWVSIVAHVSESGETGETWARALALHGGGGSAPVGSPPQEDHDA